MAVSGPRRVEKGVSLQAVRPLAGDPRSSIHLCASRTRK
jgi:hypothetical protein